MTQVFCPGFQLVFQVVRLVIFLLFISSCFSVRAQIMADEEIDPSKVRGWNALAVEQYEGVYVFGISEGESQLFISIHDKIISVQVLDFEWRDLSNAASDWQPRFRNYTNVKITANKFLSDQAEGEFVIYSADKEEIKGLKLRDRNTHSVESYEIGRLDIEEKLERLDGKYRLTKFEVIPISKLESSTRQELKIMRNEIFARYGLIFKAGGEMEKYFKTQPWYTGRKENVDHLLTEIEKENIKNIKAIEENKGLKKP